MKTTEEKPHAEKIPVLPYTPEELEVIEALVAAQKQLGVSDERFAGDHLKTYSVSTWNRLRRNEYAIKERVKTFGELRSALATIRRRIARQLKQTQGSKYYELDQFAAMFRAVADCLEKKGENRAVFYVAKTGEGKSRFIAELSVRHEVTVVRANEAWFGSYYFAALDILEALEVKGKFQSAGEARREMIETMSKRSQVLAIDEGNYFGPRSINLVKDILNETDWTVFVALTPSHWQKMQRHYAEWSQLQRRIHAVFMHESVTTKHAVEFLKDAGLNGDTNSAAVVLATAANQFGGFDLVQRVVERLYDQEISNHPTHDDVVAAIAFVRKQLGLLQAPNQSK